MEAPLGELLAVYAREVLAEGGVKGCRLEPAANPRSAIARTYGHEGPARLDAAIGAS